MKRWTKCLALSLAALGIFFFTANLAHAEQISSYATDVTLNTDSSVHVTETIDYNFSGATAIKHGIYRNIPTHYSNTLGNYDLRLSGISVADETGTPVNYTESTGGGQTVLKIGDANVAVSGTHTYVISYTVNRATQFYSDHDEIYWNAVGNEWNVPIASSTVKVHVPSNVPTDKIQTSCYSGTYGSMTTCSSSVKGSTASFNGGALDTYQGLTVVVGIPKGFVTPPTVWQNALMFLEDNWLYALPIIAFIGLLIFWLKQGRDPKGSSTIVAEYEAPDGLSPAELGTILKQSFAQKYLTAEIIQLAVKGFVKITHTEDKQGVTGILGIKTGDYQLNLLKPADDSLQGFEKTLLSGLFGTGSEVLTSSLKSTFYTTANQVSDAVYQSCVTKGYFKINPKNIKAAFIIIGAVIAFGGIFAGSNLGPSGIIPMIITGTLFCLTAFMLSEHTAKGVEIKRRTKGLKLYLSVAEKDRLNFSDSPKADPARFEKLLPYAIALGVETEWAKQFEGIYTQPPTWYNDTRGFNAFSAGYFVGSLNSFNTYATSSIYRAPGGSGGSGLGGGGFSGGGFGGGGGGSW